MDIHDIIFISDYICILESAKHKLTFSRRILFIVQFFWQGYGQYKIEIIENRENKTFEELTEHENYYIDNFA